VAESGSVPSGVYRLTSIARPVDPRYPTNRALLLVLALMAVLSAALAGPLGLDGGLLRVALLSMLIGFAAWALTRELAPDDDAAAFLALALAWPAYLFFGTDSVLLVFVALVLVRIVNRSTGLPARPLDTAAVLGLSIWAAVTLEQHLVLLLAAAAFSLNATLEKPQRYHLLAAFICLAAFGWLNVAGHLFSPARLTMLDGSIMAALAAANLWVISRIGKPVSVSDVYAERLDGSRVQAGLLLGCLVAFQAVLTDGREAWLETPMWACVTAVPLSHFARRLRQRAR